MRRIHASTGGCGRARVVSWAATVRALALAMGGVIGILGCGGVRASDSDPARNMHPEEPIAQSDVLNPIFYILPTGNAGDITNVAPEAILQDFLDKHTAMNYPAAVEAAMRLVNVIPDRPIGYYNLACALARLQRIDEAVAALSAAVARGWRDDVHMSIDPDLSLLRSDGRYVQIVGELKAARERERIMPAPLRDDAWEAVAADLAQQTPELLARYHVPGAQVALIRDGTVVWSAAFGRRDMRSDAALSVDDRFRLRAPLHLLTIAACEQLRQENKIELSALIVEAANEHALETIAQGGQSSGVDASPGSAAQPANLRQEVPANTGEERVQRVNQDRVAMVRGHSRSFSRDSAYGFLRLAAEEAAETSFPRYCEQSLFPQLDLRQSAFGAPNESTVHSAVGHSILGTPLRPSVVAGEFAPGGSMYTTAGDVARLAAAAMARRGTTGADAALAPAANAQVFEPQLNEGQLAVAVDMVTQADAALSGMLGLAIQRINTHDGVRMQLDESASGIVCLARWYPSTRSGIVVLCNSATGKDAAERIAHLGLGGE